MFIVEFCENDGSDRFSFEDPETWSSHDAAWLYWESQAEVFDLVLVSISSNT